MGQKPPILKNLTTFSDNNSKEVNEVWNISAPEKNSLYWSILIPYLIKSVKNCTFLENIELLFGENRNKIKDKEEFNFDVIEKRIKNINPFKNFHTLYRDENLALLMRIFKRRLNQAAGSSEKNYESNYPKFEAAATMLLCDIDVYEESPRKKSFRAFTTASSSKKNQDFKVIVFSQEQSSKLSYGFGLNKNYSMDLGKDALKHILKTAGLQPVTISEIVNLVPCEHFLNKLIESSSRDVIPVLYKYPYILKKLGDAGFDMNPLTTDPQGFSAFYTTFLSNDWKLFQVLYNHASRKDNFIQDDALDDDIQIKLEAIRGRLQKDYKSRELSLFRPESKTLLMYNHIIHFNKYHIDIETGIASIRDESKFQTSEKLNKTMLFILDKYFEYFHFGKPKCELDKLEDFFQNYEYHKIVDDLTCWCFFDHFLSLKVQLNEQNRNIFSEVLASLFLYFVSKLQFCSDNVSVGSTNLTVKANVKYFIIFCYRMRWYKALSDLSKELNKGLPERQKSIIKIFENILIDYPLIKEEFLLARLKIYLKVAQEANFSSNKIKAALTILRSLQVMGETFRDTKTGCTVAPLLQYCIPSNVASSLRDIRNNCLSHCRASFTRCRRELEQNDFLLGIQRELKDVTEVFEPIFVMQTFRVRNFMISFGMEESKKFSSDVFKQLSDMKAKISDLEQEYFGKHEDKYFLIASKMLDLIPENTSSKSPNYIKSYERLRVHCEGLEYLLKFLSKHSNHCNIDIFIQEVEKIGQLYEKNSLENLSEGLIKEVCEVLSGVKTNFTADFNSVERNSNEMLFPNLNQIFIIIKEYDIFSPVDQAKIRKSFSEFLETSKEQVIDYVNGKRKLENNELDLCLKYLIENKNKIAQIKKCLKKPDEALKLLQTVDCSVDNILGNEEETCFKLMTVVNSDKYKTLIPMLSLSKRIHDKLINLKTQKLEFVLERMQYLEEILINDNDYIKNLRKYGTSLACRDHTKRLLMQRFVTEIDTKAALEMLLLDCLEIFNKKEKFMNLWQKSTNLFLGINIRNILSHGCPILEVSNDLLDRDNLPMELINTALELIEDQKALSALVELSHKTGRQTKEMEDFINKDLDGTYLNLKKTIKKCGRWERYLFLFSS